jgi:hypothetical protein
VKTLFRRLISDLRSLSGILLVLSALATVGQAQQRPSFAGRWTAVPDPAPTGRGAGGRGSAGSGWGSAITISQNGSNLLVEVPVFSRYDMQPPVRFTYSLDGAETKNTLMVGHGIQEQRSRAAWRDSALVITIVHVFANPAGTPDSLRVEVIQRLVLAAPDRLVVETTRAGVLGGATSTAQTTYTRQ